MSWGGEQGCSSMATYLAIYDTDNPSPRRRWLREMIAL